jgi:AraC-like DNA-binding protein
MVAGFVRMLQSFGCARSELRAVCFEYARPAHHAAYTAAFGGLERFGAPYTGIELSAALLDRPHMHVQPELHALVLHEAQRRIDQRTGRLSYAEQITNLLRRRGVGQLPDMFALAKELNTSVRSLRRRLQDEGTSYRELTQALRYDAARQLLSSRDLTLQDIAHELGFADNAAFHNAFKRWAKLTPAEYRAARAEQTLTKPGTPQPG